MKHDEVVDWRVWKAFRVAQDAPPMYPGGHAVKKGDHVYVVTVTQSDQHGKVHFVTPSPGPLALSKSARAASRASELRSTLSFENAPGSNEKFLPSAKLGDLYEFFEECMAAVTFAFQSLECIANQLISQHNEDKITVKFQGEEQEMSLEDAERKLSTEQKLGEVIPAMLNIESPKGKKPWQDFKRLKKLRDNTIHLKTLNQYVTGQVDEQTVYFEFLNSDPFDFTRAAITLLKYLLPAATNQWLAGAEALAPDI